MTRSNWTDGSLIALDWGTTNVRAALLDNQGQLLDERRGESGVGSFSKEQFAGRFDELSAGWPVVPVIAAGMVGSRQGWQEADYLPCPASTDDLANALTTFDHSGRTISIIPGIKLDDGNRFDVMRGEESQLAGHLISEPEFTGIIVMPGTHSKWVHLDDGKIVSFRTYMTGEIFEAISDHTILRHSVTAPDGPNHYFSEKVTALVQNGGSIEGDIFGLRARHLLDNCDAGRLRQELSALLIMAELRAGQMDGFALGDEVILIGAEELTAFYETALSALGKKSRRIKGTTLVWPALFELARRAGLVEGIAV